MCSKLTKPIFTKKRKGQTLICKKKVKNKKNIFTFLDKIEIFRQN